MVGVDCFLLGAEVLAWFEDDDLIDVAFVVRAVVGESESDSLLFVEPEDKRARSEGGREIIKSTPARMSL